MRDAVYKKTKYSVEEDLTTLCTEPLRCGRQALSTPQGAAKKSCIHVRGHPGAAS